MSRGLLKQKNIETRRVKFKQENVQGKELRNLSFVRGLVQLNKIKNHPLVFREIAAFCFSL
jgi:uncharacterized transporter YbjL